MCDSPLLGYRYLDHLDYRPGSTSYCDPFPISHPHYPTVLTYSFAPCPRPAQLFSHCLWHCPFSTLLHTSPCSFSHTLCTDALHKALWSASQYPSRCLLSCLYSWLNATALHSSWAPYWPRVPFPHQSGDKKSARGFFSVLNSALFYLNPG